MNTLQRLPDWPTRLADVVARAHRTPFAWGSHDCCLWAADAGLAITGRDFAAELRGTYSTAAGAWRALRAVGGLRGAASRGGVLLPGPAYARDGDVAIVQGPERPMLAVHVAGLWLCTATRGLFALPASAARCAWGVGHA
jgi:hypothetical protein